MSFKISDKELLQEYNQIWKKVKILLNIKFNSENVYGDNNKYIKTKIKTYGDSVITNFEEKKMPKENAPRYFLSIIMLGSVITAMKKYYPQTLLEE